MELLYASHELYAWRRSHFEPWHGRPAKACDLWFFDGLQVSEVEDWELRSGLPIFEVYAQVIETRSTKPSDLVEVLDRVVAAVG